jgi:cob(I)alamin adenosyltransferase
MVVLNRIYTRTGDDGTTALGTGERRKKYDLRIAAYGTLDEVNAAIGIARLATAGDAALDVMLARIQNDLFDVEADLCMPQGAGKGPGGARLNVTDAQVEWLERQIDELNADLAPLKSFILPGGSGLPSPRTHDLPAGRAADGRAQRPAGRRRHAGGAQIRQPPVRFLVRRWAPRQRQGRVRRALAAGTEPVVPPASTQ